MDQAKTPVARRMLARQLTDFGEACRAAGHLQAAVEAWQHALQILDDLRLPDRSEVRARLERASPPGETGHPVLGPPIPEQEARAIIARGR